MNTRTAMRLLLPIVLGMLFLPANAATIIVNTLADDFADNGNCTLREAIEAAESNATVDSCDAGSGADEIQILVRGTIKLNSDLPRITQSLSVLGFGVDQLTISGAAVPGAGWDQAKYRLFRLGGIIESFYLRGFTLDGGLAVSEGIESEYGGAINISSGDTTLEHINIVNSYASNGGGGISVASGNLTLRWCTLRDNYAQNTGGGIHSSANNASNIMVENSTFNINEARFGGGLYVAKLGVTNTRTTVTVNQSTFHGNFAHTNGDGGAIFGLSAISSGSTGDIVLNITSSTIINNNADTLSIIAEGGGIYVEGADAVLNFSNNVIAENDHGIGGPGHDIYTPVSTPADINSGGFNFISNHGNQILQGNPNGEGDFVHDGTVGHGLIAFGDHGGPTKTYAPNLSSTLIVDQGNCGSGPYDQRGYGFVTTRILDLPSQSYPNSSGGNGCDIGAVEYVSTPPDGGPKVDYDSDAIKDETDNCLFNSNNDQADIDNNNIGDICESSIDPTPVDECLFYSAGTAVFCL